MGVYNRTAFLNRMQAAGQAVLILLFLLASCAPAPSTIPRLTELAGPTVAGVPSATPASGCAGPAGLVTVRVHDWSSADRSQYWDQVINAFNAAHPCIHAETVKLPEDRTMRLKELADGVAPDLVGFDSSDLPLAARLGYLRDLSPVIAKDGFQPANEFYDSVYKTGFVDGKPVAIAKDYSVSAFYVNVGLLEKTGLSIPSEGWTYDDYLKMAQKLTIDSAGNNAASPHFNPNDVVTWGASLPQWGGDSGSGWWRGFQSFLYSWGAHTISADGKTTSGYINSAASVRAWSWYRDLIHKYHVVPTIGEHNASGVVNDKLFSDGRLAISGSYWGPWYQDMFNGAESLKWQAVPLPTGPGGHRGAIMWMGWGISAKSAHVDQAWELLKWLTTDPGQDVFALKALTGDRSVAEALQISKDPYWGVFLAEVPYQDRLDDMTTPFYTTCVDIPAGKLVGKLYQEAGVMMNIRSELNKLAAEADKCLGESKLP